MIDIAVLAHSERPHARELVQQIARWCATHSINVWVPPGDAAELDVPEFASDRPLGEADLVLSLGGDGTMLRSVRMLDGAPVPLLGVNLGTLGYLTEVESEQMEESLACVLDGVEGEDWWLDERLMIDVCVDGQMVGRALNEAVVEKHEAGHTVRLLARLDGEPFTYYSADGLIVATPTGSTAYSLSARGPVVSPRHRALLLTPVSPHMLFDRTLVLDPTEVVEIEVCGHRRADLALDGQYIVTLVDGDVVRCARSDATARFVRFGTSRYHQVLKAKFGLQDG